jgi:hypothetical protein
MKESSSAVHGASKLKQILIRLLPVDIQKCLKDIDSDCETVLRNGVSSPIHLVKRGPEIIISKKMCREDGAELPDFTLTFRMDEKSDWWPTNFEASDGRKVSAELLSGGKRLTNVKAQSELIETANTWGKSISAQKVTRDLDNSLT